MSAADGRGFPRVLGPLFSQCALVLQEHVAFIQTRTHNAASMFQLKSILSKLSPPTPTSPRYTSWEGLFTEIQLLHREALRTKEVAVLKAVRSVLSAAKNFIGQTRGLPPTAPAAPLQPNIPFSVATPSQATRSGVRSPASIVQMPRPTAPHAIHAEEDIVEVSMKRKREPSSDSDYGYSSSEAGSESESNKRPVKRLKRSTPARRKDEVPSPGPRDRASPASRTRASPAPRSRDSPQSSLVRKELVIRVPNPNFIPDGNTTSLIYLSRAVGNRKPPKNVDYGAVILDPRTQILPNLRPESQAERRKYYANIRKGARVPFPFDPPKRARSVSVASASSSSMYTIKRTKSLSTSRRRALPDTLFHSPSSSKPRPKLVKISPEEALRLEMKRTPITQKIPATLPRELTAQQVEVHEDLLGSGKYAQVFSGICNKKPVAVKKFLVCEGNEVEFRNEVNLVGNLIHPNIVKMVGFVHEGMLIVMELMERGSLFHVINEQQPKPAFSWLEKIKMVVSVCSAMKYLHSFGIRHNDLNSKNLLVNYEYQVKVADLGLSKLVDPKTPTQSKLLGTVRWMSPEMLRKECLSMEMADIWSFGVVMVELATLRVPYPDMVESDVKYHVTRGGFPRANDPSIWGGCPMWKWIAEECFHADFNLRPTFATLLQRLSSLQAALENKKDA
eukprot:TRINITY_DN10961_c0_g1_i1.p1 TRINITY_DN10961_c0_g1~~TRINITY_DN10961_c0_g1_i1.p1  ORF type:complete len:675 (+),score=90.41 TRINITY_DN10961_c0_g1_i1:141-2165(+)